MVLLSYAFQRSHYSRISKPTVTPPRCSFSRRRRLHKIRKPRWSICSADVRDWKTSRSAVLDPVKITRTEKEWQIATYDGDTPTAERPGQLINVCSHDLASDFPCLVHPGIRDTSSVIFTNFVPGLPLSFAIDWLMDFHVYRI